MAKRKDWQEKYELIDDLGEGGNAKVYHVKCLENDRNFALKELVSKGAEKKGRFIDEINIIINNCENINGIIPIIDFSIEQYWYVMPVAKPAMDYILENNLNITEIVIGTLELCQTLETLHEKDVSHRDIKPSNIYYYEGKFCLGDFGLVDFPENENDFTRSDKGLGAIFTIAPEMKRNPKNADGKKADVFSLAKTMWMFLTKDEKGFDGVYNFLDESHSLRFFKQAKDFHLVELDELLIDGTANDPNARPTMREFKERLENWLEICADTYKSQSSDWNFLSKLLFGVNPPTSCVWREPQEIVNVLNSVGSTPAFNHMIFSDRGGLDFSHTEMAAEEGCIKVYDTLNYCYILKPKRLLFESFKDNLRWNYFLLEIDSLTPIFQESLISDYEYLVEDMPSNYVSAEFADYGVYDYDAGTPLPDGFQKVYRYNKGKFLIILKTGPYNGINGTYDGRHGDCSADEFRNYIENLIKFYEQLYKYAKQDEQLKHLSDEDIEERFSNLEEINKNPFKITSFEKDDTIQIKQKFAEQKKSHEYINQKFLTWNFQDLFPSAVFKKAECIKFVFEFKQNNEGFSLTRPYGTCTYLTIDGTIKELDSNANEECYCVYNRESAVGLKDMLDKKLAQILKENFLAELESYKSFFEIKIIRIGKPTHLFTKQEIKEEMQNADDRVNNQLVIDENGYAKVINTRKHGHLYPVRHESWNAGNVYVGKYSKLLTLEDDYISSLQGWLSYLKHGRTIYMDYVHENTDEEKLIAEIKTYY